MLFLDREEAGRRLAEVVATRVLDPDVVVVGLARGGVAVALEVARELAAPLEVSAVRRLRVPGHRNLSMGSVTARGTCAVNVQAIDALHVPVRAVQRELARERANLARQLEGYAAAAALPSLAGRTVVVVDDGMSTGYSMRAVVAELRARGPARAVVAVPVTSPDALATVRECADDLVFLAAPYPFHCVAQFYADFPAPTDEEIRELVQSVPSLSGMWAARSAAGALPHRIH